MVVHGREEFSTRPGANDVFADPDGIAAHTWLWGGGYPLVARFVLRRVWFAGWLRTANHLLFHTMSNEPENALLLRAQIGNGPCSGTTGQTN